MSVFMNGCKINKFTQFMCECLWLSVSSANQRSILPSCNTLINLPIYGKEHLSLWEHHSVDGVYSTNLLWLRF